MVAIPNGKTNRVRSGLRIPMDLNTKLILKARAKGISKNALVLIILDEYFKAKRES